MLSRDRPFQFAGVDDGVVPERSRRGAEKCLVCAVLVRDAVLVDVSVGEVVVDGDDSTIEILRLLRTWSVRAVFLSGITFAGFNVVDGRLLSRQLHKPVIIIPGDRPKNRTVLSALRKHFDDWRRRWSLIETAGPVLKVKSHLREPDLFFEAFGCGPARARELIRANALCSRVPEPIRLARMLARAFSLGGSQGSYPKP